MRKSLFVGALAVCAVFLGPRPAEAQGTVALALTGGVTTVDSGDFSGQSKPEFGFGAVYTFGHSSASGSNGMVGSIGVTAFFYTAAGTPQLGSFTVYEYRMPVTFGYRVGNVAFGAYFDGRIGTRSFDTYDAGNIWGFFYGPYIRIGLGPGGSTAGRFALEGRYLWGTGAFTNVGGGSSNSFSTQFATDSVDWSGSYDWRAGLSYIASPRWIVRAEYNAVRYSPDLSIYNATASRFYSQIGQDQRSFLLTVGYVLTGAK